MENKGDHTYNTIQVGEAFTIQPKNKVIDSYSGGKTANIKYIEPKKNKMFPFILAGIVICLIILVWTLVSNTKEFEKERAKTSTAETSQRTTSKTTSETTTIDVSRSEITNFSAFLEDIIGEQIRETDNFDTVIKYNGMYFEFSCSAYDEKKHICLSGEGSLLLPEVTLTLFTFDENNYKENNFIINSRELYLSLKGDKIMIVKCSEEPGNASVLVYNLNAKLLFKRENITTSYYNLNSLNKGLIPTLSSESSPLSISYYECKKGDKSDMNIGIYQAVFGDKPTIKEVKNEIADKKEAEKNGIRIVFSCFQPKK